MKQLFTRRALEICIHVIIWSIILLFPLFTTDRRYPDFTWTNYLHHAMVPFMFMVVFYINYGILIPRLLFKQKFATYFIFNLILITAITFFLQLWQSWSLPPEIVDKISRRKHPSPWVFFTRDFIGLLFIVSLCVAIRMSGRWNKTEIARREAEKERTEAELKNLRNQLNPHFLLNTLNNIYALIAFDTTKAQQAVQDLSKLLRYVLYDNQQLYVPLIQEMEFTRNYIELMRFRLSSNVEIESKLDVDVHSTTLVAPLLFISLIENAFKHGVSPTEPSYLYFHIYEEPGKVIADIRNSYFPKADTDKSGSGIGLEQVNKRLEILYPIEYEWIKEVSDDVKEYRSLLVVNAKYPEK